MSQANEKAVWTETFVAENALADYQYHGMELSGDRQVDVMDADTDKPVGVLLNTPGSGEEALVCVMGRTPVVFGETVAAGAQIRFDSSGHAMNWEAGTDTTAYCAGMCTIGGDSGETGEALIWPANARGDC